MTNTNRWILSVLVLAAMMISACSLPSDNNARVFRNDRVDDLTQEPATTTTTVVGDTNTWQLYFFSSDVLIPEPRELPVSTSLAEVLNALTEGPKSDLRNSVPPDVSVVGTELSSDGVLSIQLADNQLYAVEGTELTRAVAQLVVTATHLSSEIQKVRFLIDDKVQSVPAGEEGNDTREPVTACDFRQFYPQGFCPAPPDNGRSANTTTSVVEQLLPPMSEPQLPPDP